MKGDTFNCFAPSDCILVFDLQKDLDVISLTLINIIPIIMILYQETYSLLSRHLLTLKQPKEISVNKPNNFIQLQRVIVVKTIHHVQLLLCLLLHLYYLDLTSRNFL